MFVKCEDVQKYFIINHLESLLEDCENSLYNVLDIDEILMMAFPNVMKNDKFFVNFFISICRFTILYKETNIEKKCI